MSKKENQRKSNKNNKKSCSSHSLKALGINSFPLLYTKMTTLLIFLMIIFNTEIPTPLTSLARRSPRGAGRFFFSHFYKIALMFMPQLISHISPNTY